METYEQILSRMEQVYREESGHSAEDVSDTGLRLRVLAGELYRLWAQVNWLDRQAFPQTASGEWLTRHGEARGVSRKEAEKARGALTFSRYLPLSFDIVVPAGTVCTSSGDSPVEYETTEDAVLPAGELTVTVQAQAVLGGPEGNVNAGYVTGFSLQPVGVHSVTNAVPFTGGRDREPDDEYRQRVLAAYSHPSSGTNAGYYRSMALEYPGVGSAGVVPRASGAGTVGVYIWGQGQAPSTTTVAGLSAKLNKEREVGVTVTVQAATARTVNVAVRFKVSAGADFSQAAAKVREALESHFNGLSVGDPVYLTDLERVILNAVPATRLEFASTMQNFNGAADKIPVLGTVTTEEIS